MDESENIKDWQEILAGAEEDTDGLWTRYCAVSSEAHRICQEWDWARRKRDRLRAKVAAMEKEQPSMECLHQGALYKGAGFAGSGWLCGCGRYVPELPDGYAIVFMAFPLCRKEQP